MLSQSPLSGDEGNNAAKAAAQKKQSLND
jgi:uncharacterized lipoprotein NlpE involved in copper resistance